MNAFKTQADEWVGDQEFLENVKGMPRVFCVMTHEEEYDNKT
jgi:hypothetical protein